MSRTNGTPLLSLHLPAPPRLGVADDDDFGDGDSKSRKRWYHYLPLLGKYFRSSISFASPAYVSLR